MPRYINRRKALSTKIRAERAGRLRVRSGRWIDPFPGVHGTLPEKMVYAEFSRRNIPFLFLNDLRFKIPEIDFDKEYQADFVIPHLKLIIEVQGAYWHSMEKTINADAFKFAIYQVSGYKVLAWWDYDILSDLQSLVAAEPALASYRPTTDLDSSEMAVRSRKKQDTSKGIRTLNYKRAQRGLWKKAAVRRRKL